MDDLVERMLASCLDDIDPNPDNRTCFICTDIHRKSKLCWFNTVPSAHLIKERPRDGCYICPECITTCANCADPALRSDDPLCTLCAAARFD